MDLYGRVRLSCSFFGAHTPRRSRNRECAACSAPRRATPPANGIWAQRFCSRVHACTDAAGRPRNIIAVIRWNWGSLASSTRVLGASTCCAATPRENRPRARVRIVRVSVTSAVLRILEVSVSLYVINESIRGPPSPLVSRPRRRVTSLSFRPETLSACSIGAFRTVFREIEWIFSRECWLSFRVIFTGTQISKKNISRHNARRDIIIFFIIILYSQIGE